MKVKGKIDHKDLGLGAWVIVSDHGQIYEIYNPSTELCKKNQSVEITGTIKDDIVSTSMVGEILAVESFKIL